MRVAVIHDWLYVLGGAEQVLREILHCYPEADVFTLFRFSDARGAQQARLPKSSHQLSSKDAVHAEQASVVLAADADGYRAIRFVQLRPGDLEQLRGRKGRTDRAGSGACGLCPLTDEVCLGPAAYLSSRKRI